MKYRKKPVVVEAIQWSGEGGDVAAAFDFLGHNLIGTSAPDLVINTLEGSRNVHPGDWIVKRVHGAGTNCTIAEFFPVKPDIFASTYEVVEEEGEGDFDEGAAFDQYIAGLADTARRLRHPNDAAYHSCTEPKCERCEKRAGEYCGDDGCNCGADGGHANG